jgi:PAS domain S-box-containing protein
LPDVNGNYIMANHAFERITGINRDEMVGRHTTSMIENNWVLTAVNLDVIKDYKRRISFTAEATSGDI